MRDVRNRLLLAALLLTMASCPGIIGRAEAFGVPQQPAATALKPGAGTNTGEPDSGDTGRTTQPQNNSNDDGIGIVLRTPTGLTWLFSLAIRLGLGY